MPGEPLTEATAAQILVELGAMKVQLAVISEQLKAVPDHEARIRRLESARSKLVGAALAAGTLSGSCATLVYWAVSRH